MPTPQRATTTGPSAISNQSIALNQTYAKAFNNRGVAYLRKSEYELAIEAFDDAIKLDPGYGAAFVNRAGAYLKKNDPQRAAL